MGCRWTQAKMKEVAEEERAELGLTSRQPLDPYLLAKAHGIPVYPIDALPDCDGAERAVRHFTTERTGTWSAGITAAIASVHPTPEPPAATGPHTTDAVHLERAQAERVARLRELTADRPAHAAYLEALLAAAPDAILDDVPSPSGVSARVAHALTEDVDWCRMPFPADGRPSAYPAAYAARRQTDTAAARCRAATRRTPGGATLRDVLNLG